MDIKIIRSKKRRKTVSARLEDGVFIVQAPAQMSDAELQPVIEKLKGRIEKRQEQRDLQQTLDDSLLEQRARMSDPTRRFSDRVSNYIKYRPGYPAAIIDLLASQCGLTPQSLVADIGYGTGLLTRLFLDNGNRVFGVEPNPEMRQAGERLLAGYANFTSLPGRAEATGLADASIDFVTAGQAFHWFDQAAALREFRRILKADGWIVLVWNDRQRDDIPFLVEYENLLRRYGIGYTAAAHDDEDDRQLRALFGASLKLATFPNSQLFDYQGVEGRLLSSSYAPLAGHPNHKPMLAQLRRLFQAYQEDGCIRFEYNTLVYFCQATPDLWKRGGW